VDAWRAGELPLWIPWQLCGTPGLAALQLGALYPPHLLVAWLPAPVAMAVLSAGHLCLAAAGAFLFARRLGLDALAAAVTGFLTATVLSHPAQTLWPNQLHGAVWMPLGAAIVLEFARRPGTRGIAMLAVVFGLSLLAGYPMVSVYSAYAWGAVLTAALLWQRPPVRRWALAYGALAAAGLLGTLLAAAQLLPSLELLAHGVRDGSALPVARLFPFGQPEDLAHAWRTIVLGNPGAPPLRFGFGWTGLLVLPLAFVPRGRRTLAAALCVTGLLVVALALGPVTPVFDWLRALPGLSSFRLPQRGLFIAAFCFAVLCGLGIDALERFGAWRRDASDPGKDPGRMLHALPYLAALALVAEPMLAVSRGLAFPPLRPGVAVYHDASPLAPIARDPEQRIWSPERSVRPVLPPMLPLLRHWHALDGYEPINTRRQVEYFDYFVRGELARGPEENPFPGLVMDLDGLPERRRLLDLAAVGQILRPAPVSAGDAARLESAGMVATQVVDTPRGALAVYENPHALPRAYVAARARSAPDPTTLLARLSSADFDPRSTVYLEGAVPRADPPANATAPDATASIIVDEPDRVEIDASLASAGWLVLADTHYPGWIATVDGAPSSIRAADHLFRAVELDAGRHRVVFRYRPTSFQLGAVITLATGLVLIALARWNRSDAG
jgi:hypothetical protein